MPIEISYTDFISERTIAHQECSQRVGDGVYVNRGCCEDHPYVLIKVIEDNVQSTVEIPVERAYDFATKLAAWCLAHMPQEDADEKIKSEPQEAESDRGRTTVREPEPSDLEVMASELRAVYEAYVAAGFTDGQAMHLLATTVGEAGWR